MRSDEQKPLADFAISAAHCDEVGYVSEKVTPVPIPNTVVKLLSAENT